MDDKNLKELAARFLLARDRSGKTQEEIAAVCGLTKSAISAIENARNAIAGENLFPLADTMGVNARWLMTGQGELTDRSDASLPPQKTLRIASHLAVLPDDRLAALAVVLGIKL